MIAMISAIAAGTAVFGLGSYATFAPRCRWFAPVISSGARDDVRPHVALTFDDGPHPTATPAILDVLREHRVSAAFFMIGQHVLRHADVVRRAYDEGHLIGNHTFDHAYHGCMRGIGYWHREIKRTSDAIETVIGVRPTTFRPPMGFKHRLIYIAARRERCHLVTWTLRGRDGVPTSVSRVLDRIVPHARGGDIITLHDGCDPHFDRDTQVTVDAVGPLIEAVRKRGIEFERLDRLIGVEGYQPGCAAGTVMAKAGER
jgi:peptidoglycan/xylan/chitin deacetylase (PgdA/CDA1 family)